MIPQLDLLSKNRKYKAETSFTLNQKSAIFTTYSNDNQIIPIQIAAKSTIQILGNRIQMAKAKKVET